MNNTIFTQISFDTLTTLLTSPALVLNDLSFSILSDFYKIYQPQYFLVFLLFISVFYFLSGLVYSNISSKNYLTVSDVALKTFFEF